MIVLVTWRSIDSGGINGDRTDSDITDYRLTGTQEQGRTTSEGNQQERV
jgi:hypothetical protein